MGLLSDDFIDNWSDWRTDLYLALDAFINNPCEGTHDIIHDMLAVNCDVASNTVIHNGDFPVISMCATGRKRDAIAIMGPAGRWGSRFTWKCSKHTPTNMRGVWISRKYNRQCYIYPSPKYNTEHITYILPQEIYGELLKQFKQR